MPSMVREYRQYRIAIYSPSDHFAVVTPPGGNSVIKFDGPARSGVVEGPLVCLARAQALIDGLSPDGPPSMTTTYCIPNVASKSSIENATSA
jgi:hypothetical protein